MEDFKVEPQKNVYFIRIQTLRPDPPKPRLNLELQHYAILTKGETNLELPEKKPSEMKDKLL